MYKTFATIAVATGTLVVLEGCKSDAQKAPDAATESDAANAFFTELEKCAARLNALAKTKEHGGKQCAAIITEYVANIKILKQKCKNLKQVEATDAQNEAYTANLTEWKRAYRNCVKESNSTASEKIKLLSHKSVHDYVNDY